jgi:hypothetical protein
MAVDLAQVILPLVRAKVDFILVGMPAILQVPRVRPSMSTICTAAA